MIKMWRVSHFEKQRESTILVFFVDTSIGLLTVWYKENKPSIFLHQFRVIWVGVCPSKTVSWILEDRPDLKLLD